MLTHRSAWLDHFGSRPVPEGTLIRLYADHLPSGREFRRLFGKGCGYLTRTGPRAKD